MNRRVGEWAKARCLVPAAGTAGQCDWAPQGRTEESDDGRWGGMDARRLSGRRRCARDDALRQECYNSRLRWMLDFHSRLEATSSFEGCARTGFHPPLSEGGGVATARFGYGAGIKVQRRPAERIVQHSTLQYIRTVHTVPERATKAEKPPLRLQLQLQPVPERRS